jgi:hypothetical protein
MALTYNGLPMPTESLEEIRMIDRMALISKQNNPDDPVILSKKIILRVASCDTIKIYVEPTESIFLNGLIIFRIDPSHRLCGRGSKLKADTR